MGKDAHGVEAAAELFRKVNGILGFDLLDVCANGPKEKLDSTIISQSSTFLKGVSVQPAIYVTSLAAVEVLRSQDGGQNIIDSIDVTCGLSYIRLLHLLEHSGIPDATKKPLNNVMFHVYIFEDGLKLVKLRGEAMQDAADAANSAMISVIGLDSENAQLEIMLSGGVKGVEAVEAKAKSFKA
ncbi:hypothetical protein QJS10_CPB20g00220 [Acorus calamus]|uniref:Uncharacterized protein n=1 Tax=Acorus calamus TaxID=4465 RepID=A0AAV9CCQ8_ACOCL|nr:hypothetical protein QJS10_CPB20g00220 [Acorus calamus]